MHKCWRKDCNDATILATYLGLFGKFMLEESPYYNLYF